MHGIYNNKSKYYITVNQKYNELYSSKISKENIEKISERLIYLDGIENLDTVIQETRVGVELWRYLLYFVCMLLLFESFLSNRKEGTLGSK